MATAQLAAWKGGTAYASVSFTTPHRLTLLDATTGQRLAPTMLCDAEEGTFALVAAGPTALIGVGPHDLVEPLDGTRHPYGDEDTHRDEDSSGPALIAAVTGSADPRFVTAHPYEGLKVWDAAARTCLAELPLPDLRSPDCLCAGLVSGTTHIAVSEGGQVSVHEAETGRLVGSWTAAQTDTDIARMVWVPGTAGGPDAVLTADTASHLRVWDPRTGEPRGQAWPLPGRPLHLSAAAREAGEGDTGLLVACAYGDGVYVLRTDTGQALLDLRLSTWTRTAHLTAGGLLLLGTSAGPLALRLDAERLASGTGEPTDLDLSAFPPDMSACPAPEAPEESGEAAGQQEAATLPSHADLVALWGADQLLVLDDDLAADPQLPPQDRDVLCAIGLPRSPVPGISLDPELATDGLAPLDEVGVGPEDPDDPDAVYVPEGLDGYHWLGTWHDDDLVLGPAGTVEIVGAETDYEQAALLNSSLAAFLTFAHEFALAALRQEPEYGGEAQEARAERLERRLRAVDPEAFAPDSAGHWADALSDLAAGML
ncbi:SUKH-4 family immunity protein [Streptomyces sp. NRRL F-4489]|uniref:SUKH-4 family immunity protein n=1 Tax=Streptomyces sp. NRRL F-4489 TaxID=1609095 RepID=UPI00131C42C8|nr:SUKH-4 family immunity protein [Streptomyces sp. NRRL F-4489]